MSFVGKGPIRAIYFYHLSLLEMMERVNIGGSTSYRAARVRTSTVLVVSVTAAAVYLFLTGLSPFTRLPFRPAVVVVTVFMGIITLVLMSQGTWSNAREWLGFTSMDPATYLRYLLFSRSISALAIISPFAVSDIILALLGI